MTTLYTELEKEYNLPLGLLRSVRDVESGGNMAALSPKGAEGLFQIMPDTAIDLELDNPYDPVKSAVAAAKYLSQNLTRFGDTTLALAAYNAGPGAVEKNNGVPPFEETKNFINKVLGDLESRGKRAISKFEAAKKVTGGALEEYGEYLGEKNVEIIEAVKGIPETITKFKKEGIAELPEFPTDEQLTDIVLNFTNLGITSVGGKLTTKTLERLPKKEFIKRETIEDLINRSDVKPYEKDLIRGVLGKAEKVNRGEFIELVQSKLVPLSLKTTKEHASYGAFEVGLGDDLALTHVWSLPEELKGFKSAHFPKFDDYFAHTRHVDEVDSRFILEIQSDLMQRSKAEVEKLHELLKFSQRQLGLLEGDLSKIELNPNTPISELISDPLFAKATREESIEWFKNTIHRQRLETQDLTNKIKRAETPLDPKLESLEKIWPKRIVEEEIRQAAKEGKKAVYFPHSDTVAQVENYEMFENFIPSLKGQQLDDGIATGLVRNYGEDVDFYLVEVSGGKWVRLGSDLPENILDDVLSVEGGKMVIDPTPEQKSILRRYDAINKYLIKKYNAEEIITKRELPPVKWYKVDIEPSMSEKPVAAFGGTISKSMTQFAEEGDDLTTKVLNRLPKKLDLNRQSIIDIANQSDITPYERELVLDTIGKNEKLNRAEFIKAIKSKLVPLNLKTTEAYADYGINKVNLENDYDVALTHIWSLPEELKGFSSGHFPEFDDYFAHTRHADLGNNRFITEIQSDLMQRSKGNIEQLNEFIEEGQQHLKLLEGDLSKIELNQNTPLSELKFDTLRFKTTPEEGIEWLKENISTQRLQIQDLTNRLKRAENPLDPKLEPLKKIWPKRIVEEEIRQAAKEGKESIYFPHSDTVAQVEDYERIEKFIPKLKGQLIDDNYIATGRVRNIAESEDEDFIIEVVGGDWIQPKDVSIEVYDEIYSGSMAGTRLVIDPTPEQKSILKRYDAINDYLIKKYGAKEVTTPPIEIDPDLEGLPVRWYKVDIDKSLADEPIAALGGTTGLAQRVTYDLDFQTRDRVNALIDKEFAVAPVNLAGLKETTNKIFNQLPFKSGDYAANYVVDKGILKLQSLGGSIDDALDLISLHSSDQYYREVAKAIKYAKTGTKFDINPANKEFASKGGYFRLEQAKGINRVRVNSPAAVQNILLHEGIHASTVRAMLTDKVIKDRMSGLYTYTYGKLNKTELDTFWHEMEDPFEMVSGSFMNNTFRQKLKSIPSSGGRIKGKLETVWDVLIKLARQALGLKPKYDSVLDDIIHESYVAMQKTRELGEVSGLSKSMTQFAEESDDLTTKVLSRLPKKPNLNIQTVIDITNQADITPYERELVLDTLGKNEKLNRAEFIKNIKSKLVPLNLKTTEAYADYGTEKVNLDTEYDVALTHIWSLPEELKGFSSEHFPEFDDYFAHARHADLGNNRFITEIQSDLMQRSKGNIEFLHEQLSSRQRHLEELETRFASPLDSEDEGRIKSAIEHARLLIQDINNQIKRLETPLDPKLESLKKIWPKRIVEEEIRQAAKEGKKSIYFPHSDTVGQIEEYEKLESFIPSLKDKQVGKVGIATGRVRYIPESEDFIFEINNGNWVIGTLADFKNLKSEWDDIFTGIGGKMIIDPTPEQKSILRRYDAVNDYLVKKYNAEEVSTKPVNLDPGWEPLPVKWYKVDIKPSMAKKPITALGVGAVAIPQDKDMLNDYIDLDEEAVQEEAGPETVIPGQTTYQQLLEREGLPPEDFELAEPGTVSLRNELASAENDEEVKALSGAPLLYRMLSSLKITGKGKEGLMKSMLGPENVTREGEHIVLNLEGQKVALDPNGLELGDVPEFLVEALIEGAPTIAGTILAPELTGGILAQGGLGVLGRAAHMGVSGLLPGEEEIDSIPRDLLITGAISSLSQGLVSTLAKTPQGIRKFSQMAQISLINRAERKAAKEVFKASKLEKAAGSFLTPGERTKSKALMIAESLARRNITSADKVARIELAQIKGLTDKLKITLNSISDIKGAEAVGEKVTQAVTDIVNKLDTSREAAVSGLFNIVKISAGDNKIIASKNTLETVSELIEEYDIPGATRDVNRLLTQLRKVRDAFEPAEGIEYNLNTNEMQKLLHAWGKWATGKGRVFGSILDKGDQKYIAGRVYKALIADLDNVSPNAPNGVIDIFKAARKTYREFSQAIEGVYNTVIGRKIERGVAPEAVVESLKNAWGSEARAAIRLLSAENQEAFRAVKRNVLESYIQEAKLAGPKPRPDVLATKIEDNLDLLREFYFDDRKGLVDILRIKQFIDRLTNRAGAEGTLIQPMQIANRVIEAISRLSPTGVFQQLATQAASPRFIADLMDTKVTRDSLIKAIKTNPRKVTAYALGLRTTIQKATEEDSNEEVQFE